MGLLIIFFHVGAWGTGPFDNDTAADWCGMLNDADPEDRVEVIRQTLLVTAEEEDYLDSDFAFEAIAAATLVAGQTFDSPYTPEFLRDGASLDLPSDLTPLALRAIDRVLADDSEWVDLWEGATEPAEQLLHLRAMLAP